MEKEIKVLIINTFLTITFMAICFFFLLLLLYSYNNVNETLKETWSASLSFLSILSTLAAAYIATKLFNNWKDQQSHQMKLNFFLDCNKEFNNFDKKFKEIQNDLTMLESDFQYYLINNNHLNNYIQKPKQVSNKSTDLLMYFDSLHGSLINFIAIDDKKTIKNSDLDNTYESITKFIEILNKIKFTTLPNDINTISQELLSYPLKQLHSSIYLYYIKKILDSLKTDLIGKNLQ